MFPHYLSKLKKKEHREEKDKKIYAGRNKTIFYCSSVFLHALYLIARAIFFSNLNDLWRLTRAASLSLMRLMRTHF